ncbi:AraC family transcriptional regulator [Reichenbachiella versicolor]|uniref:AraC family transcriptional regulator n=1 Tax=Reichenbachiella versicolor TaxID=1821036 RepID=UPI000D6E65C6|nr:AraC family transcriptional regulator [Reichenbachiella versicolor]
MSKTKRDYIKRINAVLDFIEENLNEDLSLQLLSQKANYSPYHFHRLFSTVVGERLNEYITRKRIERIASIVLVRPHQALKEIAFQYGFNSDNSFSRAFRKYYGVTPTQFKSKGKEVLSKIGIEPFSSEKYICSIDSIKQWIQMNAQITIKELPKMELASMSHFGEFDQVGNMFQRLMEWGHSRGVLPNENFSAITVYHDNPNVTELSKVRHSACVTTNKKIASDGEIRPLTIEKGIYAVGRFEILGQDIPQAWKSMNTWVIENEYEFGDGQYFEAYLNDPKTHPEGKCMLEISIPLQSTKNLVLGKKDSFKISKSSSATIPLDYHTLVAYMKELKAHIQKGYDTYFKYGSIYLGNPDYSYFSLTTEDFKRQKLKFVLVLSHKTSTFTICLSGQNKSVRKKYWEMFSSSDWNKYPLVESVEDSLSIINHQIIYNADFNNRTQLTELIEREVFVFINDLKEILG